MAIWSDRKFTRSEVASHNTEDDLYIIVDTVVFDLSNFIE